MLEGEESKNTISHEDYKKCLLPGKEQLRKVNIIRSHKHEVYTEEVNKIALSSEDDKRHILEDGVHTQRVYTYQP